MDEIDLEKLFELFDRALTSRDERVVNALRSLLMIAELTNMGDPLDENATQRPLPVDGPLKKMLRRIEQLEHTVRNLHTSSQYKYDYSSPGYVAPGYGAAPGSPLSVGPWPGSSNGTGDLTLSGIDYSTAGTYTTMNTASPSLTLDTITITDSELEDILKGLK